MLVNGLKAQLGRAIIAKDAKAYRALREEAKIKWNTDDESIDATAKRGAALIRATK